MRKITFLLFLLAQGSGLWAQQFTQFNTNLPSDLNGLFHWADWDADGDYDLFYYQPGFGGINLYRNEGSGNFSDLGFPFPSPSTSVTFQWIDYDHDNDVDLFYDSNRLLINDGGGNFTATTITLGPGTVIPLRFADFNQDGWVDFIAFDGFTSGGNFPNAQLYLNNQSGGWDRDPNFPNFLLFGAGTVVGDYDKDGDVDIIASPADPNAVLPSGFLGHTELLILENDGRGRFNTTAYNITNAGLPINVPPHNPRLQLSDLNGDGFMEVYASLVFIEDFVSPTNPNISGRTFTPFTLSLDINGAPTLNNTFPPVYPNFDGSFISDFDKDGDNDILATGPLDGGFEGSRINTTVTSHLHDNNNNTGFTTTSGQSGFPGQGFSGPIPSISRLSASNTTMVDIDEDHDLDAVIMGRIGNAEGLFNNSADVYFFLANGGPNTPPEAPSGLNASLVGCNSNDLLITWNAPNDAQSPSSELTYNLRVGTSPGASDVLSPTALPSGHTLLPGYGDIRTTFYDLRNINPSDTLYISVQALDQSGAGGAFSSEYVWTSHVIDPFQDTGLMASSGFRAGLKWGDYNNDGQLDFFATGAVNSNPVASTSPDFQLFENNNGAFSPVSTGIPGLIRGEAEWVDFDNDGDLDVFLNGLSGISGIDGVYRHALYENVNGTFTEILLPDQSGTIEHSKMVDVNQDGLLDVVNTYSPNQTGFLVGVEYQRPSGFEPTQALFTPTFGFLFCNLEWADLNQDGLDDLILYGPLEGNALAASTLVLQSLGGGLYANTPANLSPAFVGATVKTFDFEQDGDLDILIHSSDNANTSVIHLNSGNFQFNGQVDLSNFSLGAPSGVDVGDFDNNGAADLFLTYDDFPTVQYQILTNDFGTLSALCTTIPQDFRIRTAVDWGDADGDGDLDVLVAGYTSAGAGMVQLFENAATLIPNTPPSPPSDVRANFNCQEFRLTWNSGSDAETRSEALSYDVRIGTSPGASDIYSGISNLSPVDGTFVGFSTRLDTVAPGTYYAAVRSVDAGYAVSSFSNEISFSFTQDSVFQDSGISGTGGFEAGMEWGDYDNDGDLDYFVCGKSTAVNDTVASPSFQLYQNNNGVFTAVTTSIPGLIQGDATWDDIDSDGDLDVFLSGLYGFSGGNGLYRHALYINNGGTFTEQPLPDQSGRIKSSKIVDVDANGFRDISNIYNVSESGYLMRVEFQDANGFKEPQTLITNDNNFQVAKQEWIDLNETSFPELFLYGPVVGDSSTFQTKVFVQSPLCVFREDPEISDSLVPVSLDGKILALDFDADGYKDLLIHDRGNSRLYVNNKERIGSSADINVSLFQTFPTPSLASASYADAGDYDNNGYTDLLLSYNTPQGIVYQLWSNMDGTGFNEICQNLPEVFFQEAALEWHDVDQDQDLDMLIAGYDASRDAVHRVYYNIGAPIPNTPPEVFTQFGFFSCGELLLSDGGGNDLETPFAGLTYEFRAGSQPGLGDIYTSPSTLKPDCGEAGFNSFSRRIRNEFLRDTVYIAYRVIDAAFGRSPYSEELALPITGTPFLDTVSVLDNPLWDLVEVIQSGWADYDRDGSLDYVNLRNVSVLDTSSAFGRTLDRRVLEINGSHLSKPSLILDTLVNTPSNRVSLTVNQSRSNYGWIDYNRDGQMDVYSHFLIEGNEVSIYLNQNGSFTKQTVLSLPPGPLNIPIGSTVYWMDMDNDGQLELLMSTSGGADDWKAFRQVNGNLVEFDFTDLDGDDIGSDIAVVDIDGDGDEDILTEILRDDDTKRIQIYENQNGQFTAMTLPNNDYDVYEINNFEAEDSRNFADFNNDGRLDFLVDVRDTISFQSERSLIAFADGQGGFTIQDTLGRFTRPWLQSTYAGDLDSDGDADILYRSFAFPKVSNIFWFENENEGQINQFSECFPNNTNWFDVSLQDIDGDNDLDVYAYKTIRDDLFDTNRGQFYVNNLGNNTRPNPPSQLGTNFIDAQSIELNWNQGTDAETPSAGLTYNLRVGTFPGLGNVYNGKTVSELGHPLFGRRMVDEPGNVWQAQNIQINGLEPNRTYYWSVQSIDHSYADGNFAPDQAFNLNALNGNSVIQGLVNNNSSSPDVDASNPLSSGLILKNTSPCDTTVSNPVAGATVFLIDAATDSVLLSSLTDSLGRFRFSRVTEGQYKLLINFNDLPMQMGNPLVDAQGDTLNYIISINDLDISYCEVQEDSLPPAEDRVLGFRLRDRKDQVLVENLQDGAVINLFEYGDIPMDIQAITAPQEVGSVGFVLSGPMDTSRTENVFTYDLFGPRAKRLVPGSYTLTATPYADVWRRGEAGVPLQINFEVVFETYVQGYQLVNAGGEVLDASLEEGETIDLQEVGNISLDIEALTNPSIVGSVQMRLEGPVATSQVENTMPYEIFGPRASKLAPGAYQLISIPYSRSYARGAQGRADTLHFQVIDSGASSGDQAADVGVAKESPELIVFPNPTQGLVQFSWEHGYRGTVQLRVLDATGKLILQEKIYKSSQILEQSLSLIGMPSGIYEIQVVSEEKILRRRLILKDNK